MGTVPLATEKKVEESTRGTTAKRLLTLYARLAIAAGFYRRSRTGSDFGDRRVPQKWRGEAGRTSSRIQRC